jgi:hypothetical protein
MTRHKRDGYTALEPIEGNYGTVMRWPLRLDQNGQGLMKRTRWFGLETWPLSPSLGADLIVSEIAGMSNHLCQSGRVSQPLALEFSRKGQSSGHCCAPCHEHHSPLSYVPEFGVAVKSLQIFSHLEIKNVAMVPARLTASSA